MRFTFLAAVTVLAITVACTDKNRDEESTLTRRERDSIIGESRLPGAGGVRRARAAADSADVLNQRLEAIGRGS